MTPPIDAQGPTNAVHGLFGPELERLETAGFVDWELGAVLTAPELRSRVADRRRVLAGAGLEREDAVAIWSEPASEFVVNFLSALASGLIAVPMDAHQSAAELKRRAKLAQVRALLIDPSHHAGAGWAADPDLPAIPGSSVHGTGEPATYPPEAAMVLFTSGSTGPSKAAVITHPGLYQNALATAHWQRCDGDDVIAGTISLFHCFAILHTVLAPLLAGAGVVAMAPFSPTKTIAAAKAHPLSILPGTPAMFEMLLAHQEFAPQDWQALRCGVSGGSLLRPDTQARFLAATGAPLLNGYGITEATSFVAAPQIDAKAQPPHSMGHPVQGVQCRVPDQDAQDGGELEVGGDAVMACYLGDPAATAAVITADGWLRTGDKVRMAPDGELFYVGRIKNVINRGGEKIHPESVESALAGPAWAKHIVAVGIPDRVLGERVAVVVEAHETDFDERELRARADDGLARHERPEWFLRVDAIPRTPTGKLDLEVSRQLATDRLADEDPPRTTNS
jgi:long-chain acyl-CoA synthetase